LRPYHTTLGPDCRPYLLVGLPVLRSYSAATGGEYSVMPLCREDALPVFNCDRRSTTTTVNNDNKLLVSHELRRRVQVQLCTLRRNSWLTNNLLSLFTVVVVDLLSQLIKASSLYTQRHHAIIPLQWRRYTILRQVGLLTGRACSRA